METNLMLPLLFIGDAAQAAVCGGGVSRWNAADKIPNHGASSMVYCAALEARGVGGQAWGWAARCRAFLRLSVAMGVRA